MEIKDYDPRIIDLYDGDNPGGVDHEYYRSLARDFDARAILDVGCGTGSLTVTFAKAGRTVVGMDPSTSMIKYASRRPGAESVKWIKCDSSLIEMGPFDFMVMTGNVAQHISDPQWERTLANLRCATNTGSLLAFESRNPAARAWVEWNQPEPTTRETVHGSLREWYEVVEREAGQILLKCHNYFERSNEYVLQDELLTFRTCETLEEQLSRVGFDVSAVWGDWNRTPFDGTQPVMVFEARAV